MGQISCNLLKQQLQQDSMPSFPVASRFTTSWLGHMQKSKRKWFTYISFSFLVIFFSFPYSFFLIFLLQSLTFHWASFEKGNSYHGVAMCGGGKFFEHSFSLKILAFRAHFRLLTKLTGRQIWKGICREVLQTEFELQLLYPESKPLQNRWLLEKI